jgi:hypothetical protein
MNEAEVRMYARRGLYYLALAVKKLSRGTPCMRSWRCCRRLDGEGANITPRNHQSASEPGPGPTVTAVGLT